MPPTLAHVLPPPAFRQALEIDAFVQRIMPPLLEQNYQRNTGARRGGSGGAGAAGGLVGRKAGVAADGGRASVGLLHTALRLFPEDSVAHMPRPHTTGAGSSSSAAASSRSGRTTRRERAEGGGSKGGSGGSEAAVPAAAAAPAGSDQFAQNAEVLITGAGGARGCAGMGDALAPLTPAGSVGVAPAAAAPQLPAAAAEQPKVLLPRSNSTSSTNSARSGKGGKAARGSKVCLCGAEGRAGCGALG